MNPSAETAKRITKRPNFIASLILGLIGVVTLFLFWPLGIVLIIIACVNDKTICTCGGCGNTVLPTSTLCPTCRKVLH